MTESKSNGLGFNIILANDGNRRWLVVIIECWKWSGCGSGYEVQQKHR